MASLLDWLFGDDDEKPPPRPGPNYKWDEGSTTYGGDTDAGVEQGTYRKAGWIIDDSYKAPAKPASGATNTSAARPTQQAAAPVAPTRAAAAIANEAATTQARAGGAATTNSTAGRAAGSVGRASTIFTSMRGVMGGLKEWNPLAGNQTVEDDDDPEKQGGLAKKRLLG